MVSDHFLDFSVLRSRFEANDILVAEHEGRRGRSLDAEQFRLSPEEFHVLLIAKYLEPLELYLRVAALPFEHEGTRLTAVRTFVGIEEVEGVVAGSLAVGDNERRHLLAKRRIIPFPSNDMSPAEHKERHERTLDLELLEHLTEERTVLRRGGHIDFFENDIAMSPDQFPRERKRLDRTSALGGIKTVEHRVIEFGTHR